MASRMIALVLLDVRMILKCELKKNDLREKIATRQKFHHSRAATGHSGGEDGELLPCKQKEAGIVPAFVRSVLGMNAYAGCCGCVIAFLSMEHTPCFRRRRRGEEDICTR